ncbi:C-type lectin domain family 12 member A [Sorex araneus]|uniref:C-type lectin domain family 12 member A n=1 Tax=Sorex araneus TaxID=42254 RepID=UPI0024339911|nr:C-type lectin domain family 12 member A [Sorex araneus]
MSEEVTYADLKFQDSNKRDNTVAFEKLEIKVYVTFKQHVEEVNKLQKVKDELQRNVSLQMMNNMSNTMVIRKLSRDLQEMARKLCRELYKKDQEHKCQPCPKRWSWIDDKCYLFNVDTSETWQDSKKKCWNQNATLLTISSKRVLEFLKSQKKINEVWLNLLLPEHRASSYPKRLDSITSSDWFINNADTLNEKIYCGSSDGNYLYFGGCRYKHHFICEKMASPVKIEKVLMNKVPDR